MQVRVVQQPNRLVHEAPRALQPKPRALQQLGPQRAAGQIRGGILLLRKAVQPHEGIGPRQKKIIQRRDHLHDLRVAEILLQPLHVCVRALVALADGILQRLRQQLLPLGGLHQLGLRVYIREREKLLHQRVTKGVDGADLRRFHQRGLAAQARFGFAQLGKLMLQTVAHLGGGGAREGDDEHAADGYAVLADER